MPLTNGIAAEASSSLDDVDYNPMVHLNAIFSYPSTLSSLPETSNALHLYQDELDEEIEELMAAQFRSDAHTVKQMRQTKDELGELFKKIEGVRERAIQTEQAITEMTADIKRLDGTKRNLTLSMTALKRLQMLTNAYEQLRVMSKSRQYRECAQLLQAVIQLMAHFKSYRSIDQIATLSRNVADLQRELLEQVCEDFEVTFAKGEVAQRKAILAEACLVMDALGDHARSRLITWYCNTQLREYRQIFRGNDEAGSLDNISRRYAWFRRMLKTYDDEHASIFPTFWKTNEMLANAYCEGTRDDYKNILQRSMRREDGQTLDVNLLLSCLQETLDFEQSLERRFTSETSRASTDTMVSVDGKPTINRTISEAFEPYLSLWVDAQDRQLSSMIPLYRSLPPLPADEEFTPNSVVPSSIELFQFYRHTLARCAKLSTGVRLADLTVVFARHLDSYASGVLLPLLSSTSAPPALQTIILVLNTADYCHTTTTQLTQKIRSRIDPPLSKRIDLSSQEDAFLGIASSCIRSLISQVERALAPFWLEMRHYPWSRMSTTTDTSAYLPNLISSLHQSSSSIISLLSKSQYARSFADNLLESLSSTFLNTLVASRPISEAGAEQLLLDSYTLRKACESLLTPPTSSPTTPPPAPPASFLKRVDKAFARNEPILKTLQVASHPPEAFVQAYLIHVHDGSEANFRKLLELKAGLKNRADREHLVEIFAAHRDAVRPTTEDLLPSNPMLGALNLGGDTAGIGVGLGIVSGGAGVIGSSAGLGRGTFDAGALGMRIMGAARDSVDRLGQAGQTVDSSSSITTAKRGNPSSGAGSASTTSTNNAGIGTGVPATEAIEPVKGLNDNLRNIGKFFRRDIGGFGGRFGGGGAGAGGTSAGAPTPATTTALATAGAKVGSEDYSR